MAAERSMPWEKTKFWPAGDYTLVAVTHTTEEGLTHSKGDTLSLDERQATRLGNTGSIASPGGMQAVRTRVESGQGSRRDEYLCQMWELAGEWDG